MKKLITLMTLSTLLLIGCGEETIEESSIAAPSETGETEIKDNQDEDIVEEDETLVTDEFNIVITFKVATMDHDSPTTIWDNNYDVDIVQFSESLTEMMYDITDVLNDDLSKKPIKVTENTTVNAMKPIESSNPDDTISTSINDMLIMAPGTNLIVVDNQILQDEQAQNRNYGQEIMRHADRLEKQAENTLSVDTELTSEPLVKTHENIAGRYTIYMRPGTDSFGRDRERTDEKVKEDTLNYAEYFKTDEVTQILERYLSQY